MVESFFLPSISRKDVYFTDTKFLTQLPTLALKLQNHRFFWDWPDRTLYKNMDIAQADRFLEQLAADDEHLDV